MQGAHIVGSLLMYLMKYDAGCTRSGIILLVYYKKMVQGAHILENLLMF